jgi:hypothetical protein
MEMERDGHLHFLDTHTYGRLNDSLGHRLHPPTPPSIQLPSSLTQQAWLASKLGEMFSDRESLHDELGIIQGHFQMEQLQRPAYLLGSQSI